MSKAWRLAQEIRAERRRARLHAVVVIVTATLALCSVGAAMLYDQHRLNEKNRQLDQQMIQKFQERLEQPQYHPEQDDKDWRGL